MLKNYGDSNDIQISVIKGTAKLSGNIKSSDIEASYIPAYSPDVSKVVDENGEPLVVYHGTRSGFSTVDFNKSDDKIGFFATSSDDTADTYGIKNVKKLFFNIRNPYIIDGFGQAWNNLLLNDDAYSEEQLKTPWKLERLKTRDIAKYAKKHGYDGVIFKDIIDNGQYTGMVYENQILRI